jgi:hypothetical protein
LTVTPFDYSFDIMLDVREFPKFNEKTRELNVYIYEILSLPLK